MADKDPRPAATPPRPIKGDGSKTEFATPATACQECETRCQKVRLAACRPTHKVTRTANRRRRANVTATVAADRRGRVSCPARTPA